MRGKDLLEHLIKQRIIELVRAHKIKITCARYRFCQEGNCLNPAHYKMHNKSLIKKRGDTESYAKARLAGARLPMVILENLKAIKPNADFVENFDEYLKQMESSQKSTATMRALKENWKNGRMSFSIKDSRISSHICNTPSDLRKHLTVQGEQSIELDLPSSHPAILARIFQPSESSNQEEVEQHALLVKLIQRGLFYEAFEHCWLQDRRVFLRWAVPKKKFSDPIKFKQAKQDYLSMAPRKGVKLIWQIIINTNRWFYESKIADELEQALPYFTKRLSGYKKRRGAGLGCELRKREADIINSIAIALDAPCATIYDGILCARRNADEVIRLTQKATAENLGFEMTPVVKLDAPIEATQLKTNNGQTMPHTRKSAFPF